MKIKETTVNVLSLIRVKHWIKNLAVFLPAFFATKLDTILDPQMVILFVAFCLAASAIYVLNDIVDVEKDSMHPVKHKRPLASGFFSKKFAIILFIGLLIALTFLLFLLKSGFWFVIGYFVMNIAYTFKLKQVSILDVSIIAFGFVLRIIAGGFESGIFVSHWLIIIVFLMAIAMAFAKRRDDLILKVEGDKLQLRKALGGYTIGFLDTAISVSLSITIIAYIIYSISPEVTERIGSGNVYVTGLFVFLGIMRYLQITIVEKRSGSPTEILWKDRFIQVCLVLWIATFTILLYGKSI